MQAARGLGSQQEFEADSRHPQLTSAGFPQTREIAMFSCPGPVWQQDDFSECIKRDYLLTLLPLAACVVSFLLASWRAASASLDAPRKHGYNLLDGSYQNSDRRIDGQSNGTAHLGPDHGGIEEETEEEEDESGEEENLVTSVEKPKGEIPVLVVELLALIGQVAVHVAIVVTKSFNSGSEYAQYSRIAVWSYLLSIALVRLLFTIRRLDATPQLWYHAVSIYGIQWFLTTCVFRGDLIGGVSRVHLALIATDFALSTFLAILAISVRRGNRTVEIVHEARLTPSPEPLASLFSLASFSWVDEIIALGYKRTLEIADVYDLAPAAKARQAVADFKTVVQATRLTYRLALFFKKDLVYQFCWISLSSTLQFAPTLLLRSILQYVENPESISKSMAWLYVILMPTFGFVYGIGDNFSLWRGRQVCIKMRALLVSEVYAKTLRRKTGISDESEKDEKALAEDDGPTSWKDRIASFFRPQTKMNVKPPKHVSSGTIINLMSVDAFKVSEVCAYLPFLFPTTPIELILTVGLLWRTLGWSSVASIIIMLILIPINAWFTRQFQKAQKNILACTDKRIHTTNEVLNNIRIVKFFAWEEKYMFSVNEKRQDELAAMWQRFSVYAYASCFWSATPLVITGLSFFLYTVVEGKALIPSVAFTALSLFSLLRYPLDRLTDMIARILESKISLDRIENFLSEEETGKYEQLKPLSRETSPGDMFIGFKNATLSWSDSSEPTSAASRAFRMINMDIAFVNAGLNIIAGPTGSGKTSLLMALLGEMTLLEGSVHLPGGYIREKLKARSDGLTDSVAYCAQQAWLVNDSIKQNITFASRWDKARYEEVIDACALRKDFEVLEAGDATLVGEKGIVVSGGQKQRISLARALYCNSRVVLLDDCLSAVDSHTAQHIFDKCINGPMMKNRTCILVTHNIALTVQSAKHVILLENGRIKAQGLPATLLKEGLLGDSTDSRPSTRPGSRGSPVEPSTSDVNQTSESNGAANGSKSDAPPEGQSKAFRDDVEDANKRVEGKSEGAVAWTVIKLYASSMGHWWFPLIIVGCYITTNVANIATNVWIRQWANSYAYNEHSVSPMLLQDADATHNRHMPPLRPLNDRSTLLHDLAFTSSKLIGFFPASSSSPQRDEFTTSLSASSISGETDIGYYLGVYAALGALYILLSLIQYGSVFFGSYRASKTLHSRLLECVMRAKFKFFDTTPLGQIVNRFSKDLQAIDLDMAAVAAGVLQCSVGAISTIILISVITPGFLIAAAFLTTLYVFMAMYYINSSRDLKRLESTNRAPLYQQFGETISGITTIRAYGDEQRFIRDNAGRINTHNRPFIYLWATNRWLALRIQWAGALVSFFAATFVVINVGKLDAGAAGISLSYALTFNDSVLWLVRLYADNEQNMNHVERVKQYLEVEQEAPARVPDQAPSQSWPEKGSVEFVNYTTRYRADLEPVLRNLNVKFEGEEKIGIVGRTGAGKSSLALAVFRGLEADTGKIIVDDVDIGLIGLQDLREAITIVPQDPTLFTGTIRTNLDPFGLFTDDEIFEALRRVHLIGAESTVPSGLATPIPAVTGRSSSTQRRGSLAQQATPLLHATDDPANVGADFEANISIVPPPVEPLASGEGNEADALTRMITNSQDNINIFHNLKSPVAESGSNLSQGQRQLLCLARAMLKKPRVLLMDEATASIDYATDGKIQETLREIRGSTIITIAHRLKTIVDYDKVLVLDKGEVVEFGPPWELIEKEGGSFRGLCESSGELDTLIEAAEKARGLAAIAPAQ